ncbi:MAG: sortase [Tissierellia bacterium]|nr:sortase [Bacillota bacterium]NLL22200.1 sortase [Tissierellia bacterium]
MKKPKKTGIFFLIAGMVLIFSALSLFAYNCFEDVRAGKEAQSLLGDVKAYLNAGKTDAAQRFNESPDVQETVLSPKMPVVEIEGYGYVGYLFIPDLKMELPVMSEWDYERLKIAPCRQFGSSRTDDFVIAAHHYDSHFGPLFDVEIGAGVFFVDMDGIENYYKVVKICTLKPTEVEAVQNSGHDLVLYTCTYSIRERIVVFCDRTEAFSLAPIDDLRIEMEESE